VKLPLNACHGDEAFLASYHRHVCATEKVSHDVDGLLQLLYNGARDVLAHYCISKAEYQHDALYSGETALRALSSRLLHVTLLEERIDGKCRDRI